MLNKGKTPWCVWVSILVLLFLMSSTGLIIEKEKIEVYPISVIIEEDNGDYYANFKKGMGQVVVGSHRDVSFITLYVSDNQGQRADPVKQEIGDGTRAIILAPVKPEEAVRGLEDMNPGYPVVLLDQSPDESGTLDTIGVGGRKTGGLLGEAAASQAPKGVSAYLFCRGLDYGDSARVYEGIRTVLDERGYHHWLVERKNQDTYHQIIRETDSPGGGGITIIASDVRSLDQVTRVLEENTICQSRVARLYGVGGTTSLLRTLDEGIIIGMIAYNQFGEEYLGAKQAVKVIQGTRQKQQIMLETIYVDEDELRDKTYEKMFYPIG